MTLTLVLPMPPNLANARYHWRVRVNKKQDYWAKLNLLAAAKVLPKPPYPTPEVSEIHARMFLGSRMDHDNAMARLKWVLDFLVAHKYIRNDDPQHLCWSGLPEQIVKRDGNYRVEITLTDITEGVRHSA